MKKITEIVVLASLILGFAFVAKTAWAAVRCETQYGGGEVCVRTGQLQIDKEVKNQSDGLFVDNLGLGDHKFTPGQEITFRLKIKNVGDATFDKVYVKDTLPSFLELVSGDLSFEITDLTVGETEEREIKAKVVKAENFPNGKTVICVVNTAETWSGDEKDKDTAQVCLERKVLGAKILPVTGPSWEWLVILGSLVLGIVGVKLAFVQKKVL